MTRFIHDQFAKQVLTVLELVYDLLAVLDARQQTEKDLEPEEQEN